MIDAAKVGAQGLWSGRFSFFGRKCPFFGKAGTQGYFGIGPLQDDKDFGRALCGKTKAAYSNSGPIKINGMAMPMRIPVGIWLYTWLP